MGLESATFIDDLDTSNPPSGDPKGQGDDHLRLIKSALKNSIKRVTRAFYVPNTVAKAADYTVLAADDNRTIVCNTTAAFTLTLPTLVAGDAGWCVYVLKVSTEANPVWVVPPSGTINGYTKVRRSVRSRITKVLWTGSVFEASRDGPPVGTIVDYAGSTLPQGHLWPDGSTFTAADFIELNTALSGNTKPDYRGRVAAGKDDMGGTSANRLTGLSGGVDGDVLGGTGGGQTVTMLQANLPSLNFVVTDPHDHNYLRPNDPVSVRNDIASISVWQATTSAFASGSSNQSLTAASGGSSTPMNTVQPTIVMNKLLVAE